MAPSYDSKRGYIPKDFEYIQKFIKKNEKVLDLGCGNGRFSTLVGRESYLGADISEEAIKIAKERNPDKNFIILKNHLNFPFENNYFDKTFCLSVLHHIPSLNFRQQFIKEAKRILKPQGLLVLTVWNLRRDKKSRKMLLKHTFNKFFKGSKLDFNDIFYPWMDSNREVLAQRYVHVFGAKELKKLLESQGFKTLELKIVDRSHKGSNISIVCQKCS